MPGTRKPRSRERQEVGGRRPVRRKDALAISNRLREYIEGRYGKRYQFIKKKRDDGKEWAHSTVMGWFRKDPRVPDTAQLLRLAREENLSLDWLLLGHGPTLRQGPVQPDALDECLRSHVVAELRSRDGPTQAEIDAVPSGEKLLAGVVGDQRKRLKELRAFVALAAKRKQVLLVADLLKKPVASRGR